MNDLEPVKITAFLRPEDQTEADRRTGVVNVGPALQRVIDATQRRLEMEKAER